MSYREYWATYDYGQGGVWACLRAPSAAKIRERYPSLTVYEEPPPFLSAAEIEAIRRQGVQDLDDPPRGWLAELAAPGAGPSSR
jgi:hypothetical protein